MSGDPSDVEGPKKPHLDETVELSETPPAIPFPDMERDQLGTYRVFEELGRGGNGVVYRALDTTLEREVAIKVLPTELEGDESILREARLLATLNHTGIASVYSIETADDVTFIVMELVPGDTLEERIKQGPLSMEETVDVILQVVRALEAAHAQGIVHCDLKPANIKVTPDGRVKILDFGIARTLGGRLVSRSHGAIRGTPGYMSPEQLEGAELGPAVDLWSVGCLLYECLTGEKVFSAPTIDECVRLTLEESPVLDRLDDDASKLRPLIEHCLAKTVADRISSAAELRSRLLALHQQRRKYDDVASLLAATIRSAHGVGDPLPAFALETVDGKCMSSKALLESGPLVVCFYRGVW